MKFTSLEEYFYKLQTVLFLLVLAPLFAFIYLIAGPLETYQGFDQEESMVVIVLLSIVAVADWLIVTLIVWKRMEKISKQSSLSSRLDGYYQVTVVRYAIHIGSCFVLVVGYFLTEHPVFAGLFALALVLLFISWPLPSKVCRDLKLKGDEKEMVLYKKHGF